MSSMIRTNKPIYKVKYLLQKDINDVFPEEKIRHIQADSEEEAINRFLKWEGYMESRYLITYKSCEKLEVDHV